MTATKTWKATGSAYTTEVYNAGIAVRDSENDAVLDSNDISFTYNNTQTVELERTTYKKDNITKVSPNNFTISQKDTFGSTPYKTYTFDKTKEGTVAVTSDIPTAVSELTNDTGYITNSVNNLTNYYDKTTIDGIVEDIDEDIALKADASDLDNYYTKTAIDTQMAAIEQMHLIRIGVAPTTAEAIKAVFDEVAEYWPNVFMKFGGSDAYYVLMPCFTGYDHPTINESILSYRFRGINYNHDYDPSVNLISVQEITITETTFNNNWFQATNDYNVLVNKPVIGNGVLTIQQNGTTLDFFKANQLLNTTVNITVPTKTSDLTNDNGFITGITSNDVTTALGYTPVNDANLATVATTGSYDDLTNKPTIGDGILILQKNGTTIDTFRANATTSKAINIEASKVVPSYTANPGSNFINTLTIDGTAYYIDIDNNVAHITNNSITGLGSEATTLSKPSISVTDYSTPPTPVTYKLNLQEKNGTLACLDDITNISGTNDGTNWTTLTIGSNTYGLASGGSSYTAGTGIDITNDVISVDNTVAMKTDIPTVPTNVSAFTNDAGYITGITSSDVTTALGYTPGTSNFSGSYNDLTNKPTIPTVNDNTITITQGGVTKGSFTLNQSTNQTIDVDDVPGMIGEVLYNVPAGEAQATALTMAHSFADYEYVDIQYRIYDNQDYVGTQRVYNPNGKMISLDWKFNTDWNDANVYGKCARYTLNGTTMTVNADTGYEYLNNRMGSVTKNTYQYQILITKVVGYKQNASPIVIPTVNTDSVFMVKTFNFNANTRNIFTININNTNFVGTGTFVQTEYDSTENVYLGYLALGLRINTSANIADDTTILTFDTTKLHPWAWLAFPGLVGTNSAGGAYSYIPYSVATDGKLTQRAATANTNNKTIHLMVNIPVAFDKDLRTW